MSNSCVLSCATVAAFCQDMIDPKTTIRVAAVGEVVVVSGASPASWLHCLVNQHALRSRLAIMILPTIVLGARAQDIR